jgi:hypothetical protein
MYNRNYLKEERFIFCGFRGLSPWLLGPMFLVRRISLPQECVEKEVVHLVV